MGINTSVGRSRRLVTPPVLLLTIILLSGAWTCFAAIHVTEEQAKKAAVTKPLPVMSPISRQLKLSGRVQLEVHIAESGGVEEVKVLLGNPILAVDATNAVKRWKFEPFTEAGAPAKAVTTIMFEFK